jgi:flagellar M-ring protein FliF
MADARPNPVFQVLTQLKELWGKQPKNRKTLAVLVALAIVGIVAFTQLTNRGDKWSIVAEASPDDSQELYSLLAQRGLAVRLKDGKVEVESSKLDEARAIASAAGLPRSGVGMESLEKSSLGDSSFREQMKYKSALQVELQRSIAALAQVQSARVQLAIAKKALFKDQEEMSSASVALHLHAGQTLSSDQVKGVRQLVAAAIVGMKPEAVVLVDQHGNLLDDSSGTAKDRKSEIEHTLTARVRAMLERVVGAGKVSVVTTAVVDERKMNETQEIYDQANPVLRSESRTVEGDAATAGVGGIAGTRGNLPGAAAPTTTAGSAPNNRLQETKNYEVNKITRQTQKPDIQLAKLHVAIVVDQKTGPDGKPLARTPEELGELTALARQAAGIDDARGDKIEVHSIAFAPIADLEPIVAPTGELPMVPIAIGGGALVVLVALIMFLKARKRSKRAEQRGLTLALPAPIADLERVLEARPHLDAASALEAAGEARALPPGKAVRERVIDVVRGDAERAAEVLTAWLSERPPAAQRGAKS